MEIEGIGIKICRINDSLMQIKSKNNRVHAKVQRIKKVWTISDRILGSIAEVKEV